MQKMNAIQRSHCGHRTGVSDQLNKHTCRSMHNAACTLPSWRDDELKQQTSTHTCESDDSSGTATHRNKLQHYSTTTSIKPYVSGNLDPMDNSEAHAEATLLFADRPQVGCQPTCSSDGKLIAYKAQRQRRTSTEDAVSWRWSDYLGENMSRILAKGDPA